MKESAATAIVLGSPESILAALALEAGKDPVRVEALRVQMTGGAGMMKRVGYWSLVLGILTSLTVVGALIGLPMAAIGGGMIWFFSRRVKNINAACSQYLASIKLEG